MYKQNPHGISQESREVDDATRGYWSVGLAWPDGSGVQGIIYLNFGQAIKVARRYGFQLPEQNVANHARLKAIREAGEPEPFVEPSKRKAPPKELTPENSGSKPAE
jgi:hypothetical protein